jgi:acetyl esterase
MPPSANSAWRRPRLQRLALAAAGAVPFRRRIGVPGREVGGRRLESDLELLLGLLDRFGWPDHAALPPADGRLEVERQARVLALRRVPGVTVRGLAVPGPEGPLAARLYVPRRATPGGPLLLYLHGGGWVYGSVASHDARCRFIARHAGMRVLSSSYRLAPEHRFPAAVEDAQAALEWTLANAGSLGAGRIGVGGDSAGGNLATVLARSARERVAFQLLLYPVTDLSREHPSHATFADAPFLPAAEMRRLRGLYLADEENAGDPRASPLQAADLTGMPPAYVALAGLDPLFDEGLAYADRLREAGADVTLAPNVGLLHGFAGIIDASPSARAGLADACRWLALR